MLTIKFEELSHHHQKSYAISFFGQPKTIEKYLKKALFLLFGPKVNIVRVRNSRYWRVIELDKSGTFRYRTRNLKILYFFEDDTSVKSQRLEGLLYI